MSAQQEVKTMAPCCALLVAPHYAPFPIPARALPEPSAPAGFKPELS
jgi:hypothetical protein